MIHSRWTSRKFLVSLAAQITAICVLLWPEHESHIVEVARTTAALLVALLSALGYIRVEGAIDRNRSESS